MSDSPSVESMARRLPFASIVEGLQTSGVAAWDSHYRALARQEAGEDIIVLSVGDPDFATPEIIVNSAINSLQQGRTRYSPSEGIPALLQAIADLESARLGCSVTADQLVVCQGAQSALFATVRCLAEAGDEVIVLDPAYLTFQGVIAATGATMVAVPMQREGGGFTLDLAALEQAVTPRTQAILLNFPHNPSGALLSESEWDSIGNLLSRHNLWLISDEVYADMCYEQPFHSPARRSEFRQRTVVIRSLSKSHAMTGWRVGWIVAPPELIHHLRNLLSCMQFGGSAFVQDAAVTALTQPILEVEQMRLAYQQRRDQVIEHINTIPALQILPPAAGIFCIVDVRDTGLSGLQFAERLLAQTGVSVLPGEAFGETLAGHIRISLCASDTELSAGLNRIKEFINSL